MQNAGLDEAQAGIKTAGKNNNFNMQMITLMTKSEEELKSPLMTEKGERESWLRTQHSKTKIMASGPITSWQIDGETMEMVTNFIFLGSKIAADSDCSHEIKKKQTNKKNTYSLEGKF